MKSFIVLFSLIFSFLGFTQHHHDPASVHGMLVFGKKNIYLSHLPMFHKPHDYQVIMKVEFSQTAKEVYLESLAHDPEESVYTLVPEKFVLPDMISSPKSFKASLYKGHFERGGVKIIDSLVVTVETILFAKKFVPMAKGPVKSQYFLIGNSEEAFLIHEIFLRPDFDFISKVNLQDDLGPQNILKIELEDSNRIPLEVGKSYKSEGMEFSITQKIYLEFDDLSF